MLRVVFAVVLGLAVAMGGVVAVADAAGPGDLLFGVDRAVEEVRLRLVADEVAEARLRLEIAAERLEEAEIELSTEGNLSNVEEALAAFNTVIAGLQPLLDQLTPEQQAAVQEALASLQTSRENVVKLEIKIVGGGVEIELEVEDDDIEAEEDQDECEDDEAEDAEAEDADEAENEDVEAQDADEGEDQDAEAEDADDGEDEDEDEDAEAEVEHEDDEAGC